MPLSRDNPKRDRNFVILILGAVVAFATVMGAYVALDLAGKDVEAYTRFLTLLVVTLVPATLGAWRAHVAAARAGEAVDKADQLDHKVDEVAHALNGGGVIKECVHEALDERGAPDGRGRHADGGVYADV